ncbi:YggS family pyridoxal phosphate-dependent enzyme [Celerinatantimonas sp. YJH-8]|uniref:YggS family pyridoxal phosphate-dependent enzyme n=1 Tax=Celerinatantimonas sp. YJH-8 TaxID=3228714 RepID=UPI0038C2808F
MMTIEQNIKTIQRQINDAQRQANRLDPITLLAVSKTKPLSAVQEAYQCGQRQFGENYVQEGVDKIQATLDADWITDPITWHFIGPLQSNKSRLVAEHFDWVQTIDRLKIAQRLSAQRPEHCQPLNVCIQINISGESTKSGISLDDLDEMAAAISQLPRLTLRGLMAIGGQKHPELEFQQMKNAFDKLKRHYPQIDTLSMGMTHDMQLAIDYGSTMVRIGTAIFGQRDYSKTHV